MGCGLYLAARRQRACIQPNPFSCGASSSFSTNCHNFPDYATEYIACPAVPCPTWTEWSAYSSCTRTCGVGEKSRTRECRDFNDNLVLNGDANYCLGSPDDLSPCYSSLCTNEIQPPTKLEITQIFTTYDDNSNCQGLREWTAWRSAFDAKNGSDFEILLEHQTLFG